MIETTTNHPFLVNFPWVDLKQLFKLATLTNYRKGIFSSNITTMQMVYS